MFAGRLVIAAGGVLFAASLVASAGAGEVAPTPQSDQELFAGADALNAEELGDTIVRDVVVGPGAVPIATITVRVGNQETILNIRQAPEVIPQAAANESIEDRVTAVIEEIKATEEAERVAAEEAVRLAAAKKTRLAAAKEARLAALERIRLAKEQAARLAAEEKARKAAEEAVRLATDEESRKAAEEAVAVLAEDAARKAAGGQVAVATAVVAETAEATTAEATDAAATEAAAAGEKLEVAAATTGSAATPKAPSLMSPEKAALLTENEILALIVGNSMTGFTRGGWWTEYYSPDGTIHGKWRGRRYLAKWSVDRGLMCFDYAIDGRSFCLMLVVTNDQVFAYQEDGSGGDQSSKLLSGNPLNL